MKIAMMMVVLDWGIGFAQPAVDPESSPLGTAPEGLARTVGKTSELGPAVSPGFVVIDQFDASSQIGIQISYLEPSPQAFSGDPTVRRFEAHARYVHKTIGLGGYAQIPFAYASATEGQKTQTMTDFGDLELGVIFVPKLALPDVGLVVHAGVTLPTGETKFESLLGTGENLLALPEFYNSLPKATTIKLGVSPMVRKGNLFARLDLGLDWNLDSEELTIGMGFHVNAGVGVNFGSGAVMLESENLSVTRVDETSDGVYRSGTFNAVAVSARMYAGAVSPCFALVIPLEQDISATLGLAMTVGAEVKLP